MEPTLKPETIEKAKNLKNQGYSEREIMSFFGAEKAGLSSPVHDELSARSKQDDALVQQANKHWLDSNFVQKFSKVGDFFLDEATDVFGRSIARTKFGSAVTDTDYETNIENIADPTRKERLGAALQTASLAVDLGITVASLGAATPYTVGRNMALGAGIGYLYDVGEDLQTQEELLEILDPDAATLIGLTAPGVFAAIGYGARAGASKLSSLGDDVGRGVGSVTRELATESVEEAGETVLQMEQPKIVKGATESVRETAQRVPRAWNKTIDKIEENALRSELRENARPAVVNALDNGLELRTINRIEDAPAAQKEAYRRVVQAASSDNPRYAEYVSGEYGTEMYKTVKNKEREVGASLGAAREALSQEPLDFSVYTRGLINDFQRNGINLLPDGNVEFTTAIIPEKQTAINTIWRELNKYDLNNLTPAQVNEIDQFLSNLERQSTAVDKLSDVYIKVPDATTGGTANQNIFSHIREVFDSRLSQPDVDPTGSITTLKRQYADLKGTTSKIENTWLKGLDLRETTDDELARAIANALRRPDSRAVSGVKYNQMYNKLDLTARANGYEGANALDASNFYLKEVEPLFKETTPPASATGIFSGIRNTIADFVNIGAIENTDKQKALRGLLDLEDTTPAGTKTPPANVDPEPEADQLLQDIAKRLDESSPDSTPKYLQDNKEAGFFSLFGGSSRAKNLEKGIKDIETLMREYDDRGISENSAAYKKLYAAREELYKELGKPLPKKKANYLKNNKQAGFANFFGKDEYVPRTPSEVTFNQSATPDPTLKTKREVIAKDVAGNRSS